MAQTKSIVVTGAGSGIGRATAILLSAQKDVRLILVGRKEQQLQQTRSLCERAEGHVVLSIDIRDKMQWRDGLSGLDNELKNIAGLFANAGVGGENHYGDQDRWEEIISINLTGTYVSIMECLPYMTKSTELYRNIVITSSCLARFGVPRYTAYCTAKEGLLGLTKSLAVELASQKILVNAICPGWVETDMAKAGIQKLAEADGTSYDTAFAQQMSFVPLQKMSQPSEIAELVSFLLLNRQTSITGQALDINNGSFMI